MSRTEARFGIPSCVAMLSTILSVFALAATIPGQAASSEPRIRTSPNVFDFGYVPEGHKVFHRYWLINDGLDTLVVQEVRPQCGCTTVPLLSDRIAPLDSLPLDLTFSSKRMKGRVNKAVRIWSNDTIHYPAIIYFTAQVDEDSPGVDVEPAVVTFDAIGENEQTVRLENHSESSYKIDLVSPPPDYLSWELSSDSLLSGSSVDATIRLGEGVPLGDYRASLTLKLEGEDSHYHAVTIPVRGIGYLE